MRPTAGADGGAALRRCYPLSSPASSRSRRRFVAVERRVRHFGESNVAASADRVAIVAERLRGGDARPLEPSATQRRTSMLRQAKVAPAIVAAAVGLYACGGESTSRAPE